ncbi:uncharacterized protein LOC111088636 [Limulus polyphemus]|uniref:Uncharacterized protein LOC111088636 n=1 Tax=Limulus polyphemus TaxID=6850 RepID=A0ABM1TGN7_LIMPO|nr:uncharacterized protein LOC111088636 [Limulus polyphemus]XP_022255043.1 uncharacterized protein LOC111088636 [Limulus polyphemus]
MKRNLIVILLAFLYNSRTKTISQPHHFHNSSGKMTITSPNDTSFWIWAEEGKNFGFGGLIIDKIMDLFQVTYREYETTVRVAPDEISDDSSVPVTTTIEANTTRESSTGRPTIAEFEKRVEDGVNIWNTTLQNPPEIKVVTKRASREPREFENEQKSESLSSNSTLWEHNTTTISSTTFKVNATKDVTTTTPDSASLVVSHYVVWITCTIMLTLTS